MADKRESPSSVSYRDVADLARQVGRHYGGDITCVLVFDVGPSGNVHFFVRACYEPRAVGVRNVRARSAVSSPWPTASSSTVAGLMFRLVYDLERRLELVEPGEAASEQGRLW